MNPVSALLFPFSILYGSLTSLRNKLYDYGLLKSVGFQLPVIAVGNLRVGGTGKTPMVEYLIRLLSSDLKVSTLSRGYGRKTSGFRLASSSESAGTVGDEPFQVYLKYGSDIFVAVGEDRTVAIPEIVARIPETELILLDDAFQHRSVRPDLNILLTEWSQPFYQDFLLPMGRLRESRYNARRADLVVVTKCPADLTENERNIARSKIRKYAGLETPIFFAGIKYFPPVHFGGRQGDPKRYLLVTGIANSQPLQESLKDGYDIIDHLKYSDHRDYKPADIKTIVNRLQSDQSKELALLTTEKDMVRMIDSAFNELWQDIPRYFLPIEMEFEPGETSFDRHVREVLSG